MSSLIRTPARAAPLALLALLALDAVAGGADLQRAIQLPVQAEALRAAGVPADEVQAVVEAARDGALPAEEAAELVQANVEAVAESGAIAHPSAVVKKALAEGKRGPALAAEIKAAHQAEGKGGKGGKG